MRLLSQNKDIDIAYDCNTVIKFSKLYNEWCAITASIGGEYRFQIAKYSKEEYARKALEDVREAYKDLRCAYFTLPSEEQIIEQINKEKLFAIENNNKIPYKG
jgi:hypothetical protein